MKRTDTVNCPPTPEGYACALLLIIKYDQNPMDVKWAENEIVKAFKVAAQLNPKDWGLERVK